MAVESETLPCGHHRSLLESSVESGYTFCQLCETRSQLRDALEMERTLLAAIREHHAQKADDRCIEDDDKLYAAASLPPCDRRVGNRTEMLLNCALFIENRCQGGGWPTYAKLHAALTELAGEPFIANHAVKEIARKALLPE